MAQRLGSPATAHGRRSAFGCGGRVARQEPAWLGPLVRPSSPGGSHAPPRAREHVGRLPKAPERALAGPAPREAAWLDTTLPRLGGYGSRRGQPCWRARARQLPRSRTLTSATTDARGAAGAPSRAPSHAPRLAHLPTHGPAPTLARVPPPLLSLLCRPDPAGADRSSLGPPRRRLATEAKAPTPSFGRGRAGVRLPPAVPGMGRVPALGLVFRSVPVTQRECGSFRSWCQSGPSAIFHDCIRGSTYTNTPATLSSVVQTTDSYEHNGRPVSAKATAA